MIHSAHLRYEGGTAISLFAGPGGLDLGAARTGLQIKVAVDSDEDAMATYRRNFPQVTHVLHEDLLDLRPQDLLDLGGWGKRMRPELVLGAPPAGAFSKSGQWLEWKRLGLDPQHGLVGVFVRYVIDIDPAGFVFESVPGLASPRSPYRAAFVSMLARLEQAGYLVSVGIMTATRFGVAQERRRLFLIGVKSAFADSPAILPFGYSGRMLTSGEALAGLPDLPEPGEQPSGKWAALLPLVPPGMNYRIFTKEFGYTSPLFRWRSRYWNFLLKLAPDRPSPTIQARPGPSTGPFHWDNRRLRVPELRRLFGFPDEFTFAGSRRSIQGQIGASVPPPMAEAVTAALRAEIR